jgi:LacI family transcriptional regulator
VKRATIKDVAAAAGVNPSTVSRALNNHPDISTELKKKIQKIAEQLDYTPSATAVNLKNSSTKTIGLILPTISKFFFPEIIQAVNDVVIEAGFKVAIFNSDNDVLMEERHIKVCTKSNLDGILIAFTNETLNINHLEYAARYNIPIVLFDRVLPQTKYSTIVIDDHAAAKRCGEYLTSKGCRHVLGVFGSQQLEITKQRLSGIKKYFTKESGSNIQFDSIFVNDPMEAYNKVRKYCEENPGVDGVFTATDNVLVGTNAALFEQELIFKINLVSISDGTIIKFNIPRIPYILHSGYEIGKNAVLQLMKQINNPDKKIVAHIVIQTPFVQN